MRAKPLDPTIEEARDQRRGTQLVVLLLGVAPLLVAGAIVYGLVG